MDVFWQPLIILHYLKSSTVLGTFLVSFLRLTMVRGIYSEEDRMSSHLFVFALPSRLFEWGADVINQGTGLNSTLANHPAQPVEVYVCGGERGQRILYRNREKLHKGQAGITFPRWMFA